MHCVSRNVSYQYVVVSEEPKSKLPPPSMGTAIEGRLQNRQFSNLYFAVGIHSCTLAYSDHEISHQVICSNSPLAPFYSAELLTSVQREHDLIAKQQQERMIALHN